jgi:hypothetical protein
MPRDVDTRTLATGTATAQPLLFVSGTLLTTPEAGSVEFLNGTFYVTECAKRRAISVSADSLIATATVTNTVTETTLYTGPVAANELLAGKTYRVNLYGLISTTNASQTITVRLKLGATTISTAVVTPANLTDEPWHARITFTVRTVGATGTVSTFSEVYVETSHDAVSESVVIDTTAAEDVTLTAEWGAADVGNVFSVTQGYMEVLH